MTTIPGQPRVFFYVQHLLGIGHLARASRIAAALSDDGFDVTVITGGSPVKGFPGPGVRHIALPAIMAGDAGFSGLTDAHGQPIDEAFKDRRRDLLLAAFQECRPDIVLLEAFPFGRRQVRFELLPLLDTIAATTPKPLVMTSLRDILQERAKPGRDEETVALIKQHFDRILVHGDPGFARLEDTFPLASEIIDKVSYTGLVAAPVPQQAVEQFDVVVSAGGGAVGIDLIRASLGAAIAIGKGRWCLITGPNLPQADFDALAAEAPVHVDIVRFRSDFASLLTGARLSVSQAGYNTVCDVLQAGCQSLLIPFTAGGETEQTTRATRLEKLGLAQVLTEDALSAQSMQQAIERALAHPAERIHGLDLNGARHTAAILRALL
ncbi:glycosyltransferase family protein [Pararhizobium antarcticum]|uniref:Glycosyl transferase n=1 Tax=Pararhizobium antarcticum TaxID=1798805 RepID=A0A657LMN5_9HYPH|nr:glycosyltransferase [Pararhizobium antarcticum]OJF92402.1 glycosyl transferase [Pararhizobium antarcticum]OJF94916.1 glycosyl transferase [Rhizobium sp. 58]